MISELASYFWSLSPQKISLAALFISLLSLWFSFLSMKLTAAEKRTGLLMTLLDAKLKFEKMHRICKEKGESLTATECKDKWFGHLPGIEKNIQSIIITYNKIEKIGKFVGISPIRLEGIMPDIKGLLKKVEDLENQIIELEAKCSSCKERTIENCEDF